MAWLSLVRSGKFAIEVGMPALKLCPEMFELGKEFFRNLLMSFWATNAVLLVRKTGQSGLNKFNLDWACFRLLMLHTGQRCLFLKLNK